ncbi:MAG TPA: hypothetical protein VKS98_08995 [Chthoniobacterales bacterium]|nr:hypothetical protein [Chthoniobacterales bacterium]
MLSSKLPKPVVDPKTFEKLLPIAVRWAMKQEEFVLKHGSALCSRHLADATMAGVKDPHRIRVLVVDRILLPEDPNLADASKRIGILTEDTRCMGFGHALIIRVDAWNERELIVHNFVHIAQCERAGGLEQWCREYLGNRTNCAKFTVGSLEEEARDFAREICHAGAAA